MKSFLKIASIVIVSLIAIFVVGGLIISPTWAVKESMVINAPVESIYRQVADLKNWQNWSVWTQDQDPTQVYNYEGPEIGAGQKWSWVGEKMGKGYLEIKDADPTKGINYELFIDMGNSQSTMHGDMAFVPSEQGIDVVWTDTGDAGNNLVKRWMTVLIKKMLSDDMKTGLAKLKAITEAK